MMRNLLRQLGSNAMIHSRKAEHSLHECGDLGNVRDGYFHELAANVADVEVAVGEESGLGEEREREGEEERKGRHGRRKWESGREQERRGRGEWRVGAETST